MEFLFVIESPLVICAASSALFVSGKNAKQSLPRRGLFCGRYNFIFSRFNPEAYFFALILNFRNFLIGILPILLVAYNELQCLGPNLEKPVVGMCPTGGFSSNLILYAFYRISMSHFL